MKHTATISFVVALLVFSSIGVRAYPTGITGLTNKTGGAGCAGCHSGSSLSIVSISGPASLRVGQSGTYTVTMSGGTLIGCDIAASSGTIAKVTSGLQLLNGELTHSAKLSGTTVQFTYTPTTAGTQTLYATAARNSKSGGWGHAPDFSVAVSSNGTADVPEGAAPGSYALSQNYPNPFNPTTTIRFALPDAADVTLIVENILGERVATLASGHMQHGEHSVQWNAYGVASGIYFYRLEARAGDGGKDVFVQTRRMILLK